MEISDDNKKKLKDCCRKIIDKLKDKFDIETAFNLDKKIKKLAEEGQSLSGEIFWFYNKEKWPTRKLLDKKKGIETSRQGYLLNFTSNGDFQFLLRYGKSAKDWTAGSKRDINKDEFNSLERVCKVCKPHWNFIKKSNSFEIKKGKDGKERKGTKEGVEITISSIQFKESLDDSELDSFVQSVIDWDTNSLESFNRYKKEVINKSAEEIIMEEKMKEWWNIISQKKNLILQGAPGTGKTYSTANLALEIIKHQNENSNSPQQTSSKRAEIMREYNGLLINEFVKYEDVAKKNSDVAVEDKKFGEIADEKQIAFVTFHQSMDYEDFIEGIKPVSVGDSVHYPVKSGIFKAIANKAKENPDKNYVLIIDEINRGNVSKIFGELITLLEADKRTCWKKREPENQLRDMDNPKKNQKKSELEEDLDKNPNAIKVVLPYSQEEFSVPSNLYIIGTMNTTDRSAGSLDYAIRRRFAFVTLESSDAEISEGNPKILYNAVKKFIEEQKAESDMDLGDLMIGHSYFMGTKDEVLLQMKWQYEILPLLIEYHKDGLIKESPLSSKDPDETKKWINNFKDWPPYNQQKQENA